MISSYSSTTVSLSTNFPPKSTPPTSGPPTPDPKQTNHRKPNKGSSQLLRWSRARAIRSGVKLDQRPPLQKTEPVDPPVQQSGGPYLNYLSEEDEDGCVAEMEAMAAGAKHIYMVSDGTGWTAEHSVNAALGQFEHCLVDRGCPVNTHLFSGIDDVERLIEIIKQAAREGAMLIYTLADENMAASARHACKRWGVPSTDLLSPITEAIALHLGVSPSGLPRGAPGRKFPLTEDYFKRIDAVEFTIKQDDGALPQNLHRADIVLAGVSRTGKTPLSIYLAQKGFKVANVPIVMGVPLPQTLFKIDQENIFALTINPVVLHTIRRARAKTLGLTEQAMTNYAEMDHVRQELDFACKIFAQNPTWPVIEVTGKAIEETAVTVLRLYQDRKNRSSHWSLVQSLQSHSFPTVPTAGPPTPDPKQANHRKPNKGSSQLLRWSRARAIRSGVKLDRPPLQNTETVDPPVQHSGGGKSSTAGPDLNYSSEEDEDGCVAEMEAMAAGAKHIYMVSDGTGWTAEHSVNAALGQFEHCLVDRGCPVNTHLFSGIDDVERLMEIIKQAAREGAMLIYTLADENMAASARHACKRWGVPTTDLLSPITEAIALHLGVSPSGLPRGAPGRKFPLTKDYFKRIDAVEFTIKQDDGALPQNLHRADIVLAGVSRTGKTPLSIYLAQKGFKVANVPIVMGVALPQTLFMIDQEKIFALTINPVVLHTIRRARAKTLGLTEQAMTIYAEMDHVRQELDFACKIFAQNPTWPVIEMTGKAIEETAVTVLRLYQDRKNRCSMPRIS